MKKSHNCPNLEILFSKFYLTVALFLSFCFLESLKADQNNTSFIVAGGDLNSPYYTLTFEANGSAVDFESYPLRKGNTYAFKPGNITASHPFNIGVSHNVSSPHVTGGPLDQNSANNGQSMTVSIPNDFQGTIAYFCTVHASMIRTFTILEPNHVDQNGSNFLPIYDLNSTHLHALTSAQGVVVEGNYSIVQEMNATNNPEIRIRPMFFLNGDWQIAGQNQFYNANQNIQSMQDVDAYLQSQNLHPVNGPQGHPIYDLNATQVTYLTNDAVNQAGHYAVVDVNQSHVDLEPVQQDGNGSWIVTPADDYVNLVPSRFSDINATKAWFDANASAPVAYLPFDNNHSQPGDHNQTNPGSGPNDHNTSGHLAVFDLNSSHLYQLTGSESAPEGNYSIVEQDDGQGGTYLTALPMQFSNGQWQEDPQGIPYPLNSQAFPVMQDVDAFLQSQNLYPVNGHQGHPIYDLNTTQVTNLTNGAANQAGHYAVVDVNQSHADLEPVQQDGNGSWIVTPADDYVNLVPSRFSDINATKAWFDANASAPVAYLPFDNNQSQPSDHNQTNPGSGPNDHNGSTPPSNVSPPTGGDHNGTYPNDQNQTGLPVFSLSSAQTQTLINENAPAGSYAVEIFWDYNLSIEHRLLVEAQNLNGVWEREFDALGNPVASPISSAQFPNADAVYQYIDQQNLQPIGFIVEHHDHNGTAPGGDPWDHNGTDPGNGGDYNDTEGLPVFNLTMNQAESLTDAELPADNYAIEIFFDYDDQIEKRLLVKAILVDGIWERAFDSSGDPLKIPISSAHFPTPYHIYQYH
jgi:plastocyanin